MAVRVAAFAALLLVLQLPTIGTSLATCSAFQVSKTTVRPRFKATLQICDTQELQQFTLIFYCRVLNRGKCSHSLASILAHWKISVFKRPEIEASRLCQ